MSWNGRPREEIATNRRRYFDRVGLELSAAVAAEQVHGSGVVVVEHAAKGRGMLTPESRVPATDALITNCPGLILTTLHADCAPIYFYDPISRVVGLAHAGWRGILAGIAGQVVETMTSEFGCDPQRLQVEIGPTISPEYYEVAEELAHKFRSIFSDGVCQVRTGRVHVDLVSAIRIDLIRYGVSMELSSPRPPCTFAEPRYSSFRRDGNPVSSMLAWLMLCPK